MNSKENLKGGGGGWGIKRKKGGEGGTKEKKEAKIEEDAKQTIIRLNCNWYWKYGSGDKRIN